LALAAQAATTTIPIVISVSGQTIQHGFFGRAPGAIHAKAVLPEAPGEAHYFKDQAGNHREDLVMPQVS
jgi:hypothetical protein